MLVVCLYSTISTSHEFRGLDFHSGTQGRRRLGLFAFTMDVAAATPQG